MYIIFPCVLSKIRVKNRRRITKKYRRRITTLRQNISVFGGEAGSFLFGRRLLVCPRVSYVPEAYHNLFKKILFQCKHIIGKFIINIIHIRTMAHLSIK